MNGTTSLDTGYGLSSQPTTKAPTAPRNQLDELRRHRELLQQLDTIQREGSQPLIGARDDGSVLCDGVWVVPTKQTP
jgi:hypothetical protein